MSKFFMVCVALFMGVFSSTAFADFEEGGHAAQVDLGFNEGGAVVGFEYENGYDRTFGLGGYFRMYSDSTDTGAPEITTLGAFIRPHFNRQNWDFFVSPGFGIVFYDPAGAPDDETLLGPSIQYGLLYEFTTKVAFGVDHSTLWGWFGEEDYRGELRASNVLAAKFRFIF